MNKVIKTAIISIISVLSISISFQPVFATLDVNEESLSREAMIGMLTEAMNSSKVESERIDFEQAIQKVEVASEKDLEKLRVAFLQSQEVAIGAGFYVGVGASLLTVLIIALLI